MGYNQVLAKRKSRKGVGLGMLEKRYANRSQRIRAAVHGEFEH